MLTLEDLIDTVEMYGVYVASLTGNIDLTTDAGISSARSLVNQRNQESRNTARRVIDGKRRAAMAGGKNGGRLRPFGWRKDREHINQREAAHIRREIPRILAGVSPLTIAKEWNDRGIPTVTGAAWRVGTIRKMYVSPRMCGWVIYRGEILYGTDGKPAQGKWEPILTEDERNAIVAKWGSREGQPKSRLGAIGRGYRTIYLLSPFVRCGVCGARMMGTKRRNRRGEMEDFYRCPAKGAGGCSKVTRIAEPVNTYIKALVIAEKQKIQFRKLEDLPPWPKAKELASLQTRINDQQKNFELGNISAERHFPALARMEAAEAELKREQRQYEGRQQTRRHAVANLAEEWEKPDFTMEQKQAAIGETLAAIIIKPVGKGGRFHPDQIVPVFRQEDDSTE